MNTCHQSAIFLALAIVGVAVGLFIYAAFAT